MKFLLIISCVTSSCLLCRWCAAMLARPEVKKTMMDDDFYAKGYESYAVGAKKPA